MKKILFILVFAIIGLSASAQTAYITDQYDNSISVINLTTNTTIDTITGIISPSNLSVSPDGTKVFVNNGGTNTVSVINTATNTVTANISVGISAGSLRVSPDGTKVYVVCGDSTIWVINTANNTVLTTITLTTQPEDLCISPDGSKVYVAMCLDSIVDVINTSTNTVSATIPLSSAGNSPCVNSIAISPDGSKVYVGNLSGANISVINTASNTVSATIPVWDSPMAFAFSPDGNKAYVSLFNTGNILIINTASNMVTDSIQVYPYNDMDEGLSISPDGTKLVLVSESDTLLKVVSTATKTVLAAIPEHNFMWCLGNFISIYPFINCGAHYTTSYDSVQNNFTLIVDSAAAALATAYHWDFGDGATSTLATPTHTFSMDTVYDVCMKIYTASGDSCEYCHYIGKDYLGNIIRTAGFTLNVQNNTTVNTQTLRKETSITINPNPFTYSTTIAFSEVQKNTTIKIMDIIGKEIKTITLNGASNFIIDRGELQAGIYFVQITDASKNVVNRKIIIQ